jgi:hypothetical protein
MKQVATSALLALVCLFIGIFFDPEGGGDVFFQNFNCLSMLYIVFYPRR